MIRFNRALSAWGTAEFNNVLKQEIEQLPIDQLPLQQGLSTSSYAINNNLKAMIIGVSEEASVIRAKVGLFYSGIIAGCSCADDPTPVEENNEYCEIQIDIDKYTAEATISFLDDN